MVCTTAKRQNMGSTPQETDEDATTLDTDAIIAYTRSPKKRPEYIPRSRSLEDLPGGLRVPIIRRPESRVQPRLQAVKAGLEELNVLRKKQKQLIDDAKTLNQSNKKHHGPPNDYQTKLQFFIQDGRRFSTSNLSSIKEEDTIKQSMLENEEPPPKAKPERAMSMSDATLLFVNDRTKRANKDLNENSSDVADINKQQEPQQQLNNNDANRNTVTPSHSRSASVHEIPWSWSHQRLKSEVSPPNSDPRLSRRPSYYAESIITKDIHRGVDTNLPSEKIMNCNFPSPLHAVLRQYQGSYKNILQQKHDNVMSKVELKTNKKEEENNAASDLSERESIASLPIGFEKPNRREESFTSDYFGSVETIHSILSLPVHSVMSSNHNLPRRYSLPSFTELKFAKEKGLKQRKQTTNSLKREDDQGSGDRSNSSVFNTTHNTNSHVPKSERESCDESLTESTLKRDEGYVSSSKVNLSASSIECDVSMLKGDSHTRNIQSDTEDDVFETIESESVCQKRNVNENNNDKEMKGKSVAKLLETSL